MIRLVAATVLAATILASCDADRGSRTPTDTAPVESGAVSERAVIQAQTHSKLPQSVANNAVALVRGDSEAFVISALGLGEGKTWRDTLSDAYLGNLQSGTWEALGTVPEGEGRLAATAVAIGSTAYLFGGYTVAEDHTEVSVPSVYAWDLETRRFRELAPMPVPVDDAVSFVYDGRWIYLVSGWHDSGNVNLVQLYDPTTDSWQQATPYPGDPVFGHAGGLVGRTMVICDGVRIATQPEGRRQFEDTSACFRGEIDADDPTRISWNTLPPHPGTALYRMAATGSEAHDAVIFAGGSDNPYNYNGIGYDEEPSAPSALVFAYEVESSSWRTLGELSVATMDHRGLVEHDGELLIVGGMRAGQQVSDEVLRFSVSMVRSKSVPRSGSR